MPAGISERLRAQIRERGTTPITVDVSEFLKKGGGSVKCMVADLGPVLEDGRPRVKPDSSSIQPRRPRTSWGLEISQSHERVSDASAAGRPVETGNPRAGA